VDVGKFRPSRFVRGAWRRLERLLPPSRHTNESVGSISAGVENYINVCRTAVLNPKVFSSFRRNPGYTQMLEHVSETQGKEYLAALSPNGRAAGALAEAAKNDTIGGPAVMRLTSELTISPTTLRYLKVADDLERLFGGLENFNMIEIGVGYGGQCRIIDSLFKINSYTLVDLRPVLNLASEFLAHFPLRSSVRFLTMNELAPRGYDLAISNYAFTELHRSVQETYFSKILRDTPRGYITYNNIASSSFKTLTPNELCTRLNGRVVPEVPLTHPNNCIIVWGETHKRTSPESEPKRE
jgi:hypothetical protein